MSEKSTSARPSQVTVACWVAVIGSALLVLTLFDSAGRLRSVEFRDAVEEFLATPVGAGLGLDVQQIVEILRVLMLVSGAAAAAALVLAIFVLQRHRGARIGYTIAAVIVMVTAPASGSLFPVMLAFAAMMLWTKPARDWFAGVPVGASGRSGADRSAFDSPAADPSRHHRETVVTQDSTPSDRPDPHIPEDSGERPLPPPTEGFGAPEGSRPDAPQGSQPSAPQGGPSYGQPAYPPYAYPPQGQGPYAGGYPPAPPTPRDRRPTNVTIATWLTWGLSAFTLFGFVMVAFVLLVARDDFLSQVEQNPTLQDQLDGIDPDQIIAGLWVVVVISLVWCLAAIVLAWFAFRGANWARIVLVVSAGATALFSILSFPVGLLHLLGAGAVIALLFTGGANEWYARQSSRPGGGQVAYQPYGAPYGHPPYGQQPPPYAQQPPQSGQPPYGQQPPSYGEQPPQHGQQYGQPPQGQQPPGPRDDEGRERERGRGRDEDEPPPNVW